MESVRKVGSMYITTARAWLSYSMPEHQDVPAVSLTRKEIE
jgi:hypothetical protein